jgi:hypothetical protein
MCSPFPQHDASTFAQIVSKTPKDKSACGARFWLPSSEDALIAREEF